MPNLPTKTITFLFTDIEGSTRLWEDHPEAMRVALARHDELLRQAIETNNGVVFKTIGDAFCAAFADAPDALTAALQAQRELNHRGHGEHGEKTEKETGRQGDKETQRQSTSQISQSNSNQAEGNPQPLTFNLPSDNPVNPENPVNPVYLSSPPVSPVVDIPLRVRVALHTGTAELRDNDYFGQPLNRVARLLAIGHGGQTLLSEAARAVVGNNLPSGAALRDMGAHRLKDLQHPEQVWQVLHPDLPTDFPPLRSLNLLLHNLPIQTTSFIGREKEIAGIKALLANTRLLTLTGSGGTGKTRLMLQVAAELARDGVLLVELAPLADPALVPQAVASVLNVREEAGKPMIQTLTNALKPRKLLLLLDNCEHVLDAAATVADALLKNCPDVKILASSREGLGVLGEQTYRVPSMGLPPALPATRSLPAHTASAYEAVRLFADRATLVKPEFTLTDANAPAVARLCFRLDGIPLALELAAARVRAMPVEQIETRLNDRFRLLTGGSRTSLPRQQTLRALIDWSYDLLSEAEKALLLRLSVFAGGWTLEDAEQVCTGDGIEEWDVLDLLTALLDKSLVVYEEQEGQERYRLLETVRQYARDRLVESGAGETYRTRHRDYFLRLTEAAQEKLKGAEQGLWLQRLEVEHDNLRVALDFCLDAPEGAQTGLQLGGALYGFWWTRGHLTEGRERLAALLARPEAQEPTQARIGALNGAGALAWMQGDAAAARLLHEESLAIARKLEDKRGIVGALNGLGRVANQKGDYAAARSFYEESLALVRELGNKQGTAGTLIGLGNVANQQGDYAAARSLFKESLALQRELEDKQGIAISLNNLGNVAQEQGDYAAARLLGEESLAKYRELGDKQGTGISLVNLGNVANQLGDDAGARSLYEEGLAIQRELGDRRGIALSLVNLGPLLGKQGDYAAAHACLAECLTMCREIGEKRNTAYALEGCAELAHRQHHLERAVRLYGAAYALRETIGSPLPPDAREEHERNVSAVREEMGAEAFLASWAAGQAMTLEQAIKQALKGETDA